MSEIKEMGKLSPQQQYDIVTVFANNGVYGDDAYKFWDDLRVALIGKHTFKANDSGENCEVCGLNWRDTGAHQ